VTFTEEWFGPGSCLDLAGLVEDVEDVPGLIIEIGSWEGRSTIAIANACRPRVVHAVDTWKGSAGEPSEVLAARRDVFATWQANITEQTAGNVQAHRCDWRFYLESLNRADPPTVAFVFIDAEHDFQSVYDCIAAVRPFMAEGGIICGDDIHHPPVISAVFESFPDEPIQQLGPIWARRL